MYRVEVYLRVRRAVMVEGMSIREAAREFGLHRDTVRKMLAYSVPPGYRRQSAPRRPKLEPYSGVIDQILEKDHSAPKKQRHTAKRIFERLRDEYGFGGGYTTVKDYVRGHRRQTREMMDTPLRSWQGPGGHAISTGDKVLLLGAAVRTGHQGFWDAGGCGLPGRRPPVSPTSQVRSRESRALWPRRGRGRWCGSTCALSRWTCVHSCLGLPSPDEAEPSSDYSV